MMRGSGQYDPHIRHAILCLRGTVDQSINFRPGWRPWNPAAGQHKIIALTNNFGNIKISDEESARLDWTEEGPTPNHLRMLFDDFCDSSSLGMRSVGDYKISKLCTPFLIESQKETWTWILSAGMRTQRH